jgi:hypothetical protein
MFPNWPADCERPSIGRDLDAKCRLPYVQDLARLDVLQELGLLEISRLKSFLAHEPSLIGVMRG